MRHGYFTHRVRFDYTSRLLASLSTSRTVSVRWGRVNHLHDDHHHHHHPGPRRWRNLNAHRGHRTAAATAGRRTGRTVLGRTSNEDDAYRTTATRRRAYRERRSPRESATRPKYLMGGTRPSPPRSHHCDSTPPCYHCRRTISRALPHSIPILPIKLPGPAIDLSRRRPRERRRIVIWHASPSSTLDPQGR